ncbi:ATP-binding cassette domain-containing protein [Conexibacter sp. JD483]|nr:MULTISPECIES: ATP-binding cassette domain-containing protein [unclassified Conexibacter]MDO8184202.1 ATP-binding cassette domain-containing protein [Conexibacter sp. CPCC 205706]MDO8197194.1 ATP-binding cassette domain-containing protein [Conexibacter sp. CPCC 205762]MDR9367491.1 ATP-binding cassette domain-containing protein [Conexibacter sp. JD483]
MTATATSTPLLELRGVSKSFGAVQALSGVDFDVHAGEVVGLVGDNGAGKSTLVKVMSGIHVPDGGAYLFEGQERHVSGPNDPAGFGVATVYQDLALCDNLDVVANLFIGREIVSRGPAGLVRELDEPEMEKRSADLLKTFSINIPSVRSEVGTMSGGQRQSIAIARALVGDAKVVLLDEPTAALGVAQTAQVLALVRRLRERGLGVVIISHNLADVFEVCDRVFVMRLGRRSGVYDVADTTPEEIVGAITGGQGTVRTRAAEAARGADAAASQEGSA